MAFPAPEKLSRGYVVIGDPMSCSDAFSLYQKKYPGVTFGFFPYDEIGIDQARGLSGIIYEQTSDTVHCLVIPTTTITPEAQNALLKTLEEIPANTTVMFQLHAAQRLLPTFLSRMHKVTISETVSSQPLFMDTVFLSGTTTARIAIIDAVLKRDEISGSHIHNELIYLYNHLKSIKPTTPELSHAITEIARMTDYPLIRGGSSKLILHYVAHLVPRL